MEEENKNKKDPREGFEDKKGSGSGRRPYRGKRGRGRKDGGDDKRDGEKKDKKGFGGPGNDFSWWNKYPELLKDAVTVPNNYIAGEPLDVANRIAARLAGVLSVKYIPVYGAEMRSTDPINIWARDMMLRIANKYRSLPYSGCDIAMVTIAGCEVLREIMETERILGAIRHWSVTNTNFPYAIMCALGLSEENTDKLRKMYVTVRNDLNTLIERAKKIFVFKDMSLVANIISLSAYLYLDHDNSKSSQVIAFNAREYGIYHDTTLTFGGAIEFTHALDRFDLGVVAENPFATTLPRLTAMIDALINSDGAQRIYRDLVAFFGEDAFLKFNYLPEDYEVIPVYSESILHKLHNIDPLSGGSELNSVIPASAGEADVHALLGNHWVYQYNGIIISKCTLSNTSAQYLSTTTSDDFKFALANSQVNLVPTTNGTTMLDTYHLTPDEETVTEGLMWKSVIIKSLAEIKPGATAVSVPAFELVGCAFELINELLLFNAGAADPDDYEYAGTNFSDGNQEFAAEMACIDWAPLLYTVSNAASGTATVTRIYGDYDNILSISPTIKARTYRAVILSGLKTDVQLLSQAK